VPKALTLSGLAAVFAAGLVLAVTLPVGGGAADATTTDTATTDTTATDTTATETTTTTAPETSTETTTTTTTLPGRTVTVETTTTNFVTLPTQSTPEETSASGGSGTEAWVWVLLGILAAGLIALIVLFATRGHGGGGTALSPEDRLRRLDGAVASWAAQGWAVETQTADSAVLRRGAEAMLVSVDPGGHVATRPLAEPPAPPPSGDWPGGSGDS
jgi:hypothetical protein